MSSSKIEWTESTWNPTTGCTKISSGCANCYAERMAARPAHIIPSLSGTFGIPTRCEFKVKSWMKHVFLIFLSLIMATETYYNLKMVPKKANRILNLIFLTITSVVGIYLTYIFVQAAKYLSVENSVIVSLPFEGEWIATGAGASGLTNHHDRIKSQKYTVDIARNWKQRQVVYGKGY
jgi:hypothetical protein